MKKNSFSLIICFLIISLISNVLAKEMSSLRQLVHQRLQKANRQLAEVKNPLVKAINYNLAQKSILGLHPETIGLLGDLPEKLLSSSQNLIDYEKKLHNREFHPESITSLNFRNKPETHILKHQNFQPSIVPTPFPPYVPNTSTKPYLSPFAFTSSTSSSFLSPTNQQATYYQNPAPQPQFFAPQIPNYDKVSIQSNPRAELIENKDQNRGIQNQLNNYNYQEPISYGAQLQRPIIPFLTNVDQSYGTFPSRNNFPFFDNQGNFDQYNQPNPQSQLLLNQRSQLEKFQSRKRNPNHQLFNLREKEKDNLKQSFSDLALSGQRFIKAKEFKFEKSSDSDENNEEDTTSETLMPSDSKPTRKIKKFRTTTSAEPEEYEAFLVTVPLKPEVTTTTSLSIDDLDENINETTRKRKFKTKSPINHSTIKKTSSTTTTTTTESTTSSTTTTTTTTTSTTTTTPTTTTPTTTTTTSTTTIKTTTTTSITPSTTPVPSPISSTVIKITTSIIPTSTIPFSKKFVDDDVIVENIIQDRSFKKSKLNELLKSNTDIDRLLDDPEFLDQLIENFKYLYEA